MAWITNAFDRSPAELLWVPENGNWGELNGRLLNLSYGYGMAYIVPHEVIDGQAQGGLCAFPIDRLPTGIHRGRFHPETQDLFAAGMFAWAGSQRGDGGLYRIRKTENPAYMPTELEARKKKLRIRFSDKLPKKGSFSVSSWNLKRTRSYGSKHYDTKKLEVAGYAIKNDWLELEIPELAPTWCMEINCEFENGVKRVIHNSIHQGDGRQTCLALIVPALMNLGKPAVIPPLDPDFVPASLWIRDFNSLVDQSGEGIPFRIALQQPNGSTVVQSGKLLSETHPQSELNHLPVERLLKFMLWACGEAAGSGTVRKKSGNSSTSALPVTHAENSIATSWPRSTGNPWTANRGSEIPEPSGLASPLGRNLEGCRIGFDLGEATARLPQ